MLPQELPVLHFNLADIPMNETNPADIPINETPQWIRSEIAKDATPLSDILSHARENYTSHTDWYLRHRDSGFRLLGLVFVANFSIGAMLLDHKLNPWLAAATLCLLCYLALAVTILSVRSCRQAYSAALEHALLMSKIAWAAGWAQPIYVIPEILQQPLCPAAKDQSLFVPRYLEDAAAATDTKTFVAEVLAKAGTTYFTAKWTLVVIGLASGILGYSLFITAVFMGAGKQ